MENKTILLFVAVFLMLICMMAGYFYFSRPSAPPASSPTSSVVNTLPFSEVNFFTSTESTDELLNKLYSKEGSQGVLNWLEKNVKLPANITLKFKEPTESKTLHGVVYLSFYEENGKVGEGTTAKIIKEWGVKDFKNSQVSSQNFFPNGVNQKGFGLTFFSQKDTSSSP